MSSKENSDVFGGIILLPLLFLLIVWGLWYKIGPSVIAFFFMISPAPFELFAKIPVLIPQDVRNNMLVLAYEMRESNPSAYGFDAFKQILGAWGYALNIILLPALGFIALRNWKLPINYYYRRNLNLEQLARQNCERFPSIKIVIGKNLHKGDQFSGPWKTAYDYIDFAAINGLLLSTTSGKPVPIPAIDESKRKLPLDKKRKLFPHHNYVRLNKDKTDDFLRKQLGDLWQGVDALPPHVKALATVFMSMAAGGDYRGKGRDLMEQLSRSVVEPKIAGTEPEMDLAGVNELASELKKIPDVQAIISKHAYISTVMIALLIAARNRAGKVPPSDFLWLRPINRPLWYALHPIGGRKPWTEGMAAWAHHAAECDLSRACVTPVIEGATDSFEVELHKERWIRSDALYQQEQETLAQENQKLEEAERLLREEEQRSSRRSGKFSGMGGK